MAKKSKKSIPRESPTFTLFPKLPFELRQIIWTLALPKPCTKMVTCVDFVTYDERQRPVKNYRADHDTQTAPCVLHVCTESQSLSLKTYKRAFTVQLRGRQIIFNFQSDTLFVKDSHALESFCGGYRDFEKSGFSRDLKENVRHLPLGTFCASHKLLDGLANHDILKTFILEILKCADWRMEADMENLKAMWRSRLEKENADNQSQSGGSASIEMGGQEIDGLNERLPKIQWLTEAKSRQKSNRERKSRPKGAKRETSPAPYKPPELRSGRFRSRYEA